MTDNGIAIRALADADLDPLVALDRSHSGGVSRRGFFEKRLQAMAEDADAFIGLAADEGGTLVGFVIAQLIHGEFGATGPFAFLDAVGVANDRQGRGIGADLLDALIAEARARGAGELRTRAQWDRPGLLDFFARAGFTLAPRTVLERSTAGVDF